MEGIVLVTQAAHFAATVHTDHRRKGSREEPYFNHLSEVAELVAEATDGKDPALVAAAYLHDVIEDQEVKYDELVKRFGDDVAKLVREVTDDKSLSSTVRKRRQVTDAAKKSKRARILKTADKISNLRALENSPPPTWTRAKRLDYVAWAREVHVGLRGASPTLDQLFEKQAVRTECALAASKE